jgi:hypothetical protein
LRVGTVSQHLLRKGLTAVTSEGQLLAIGHCDRDGPRRAGDDLLTGIDAITLDQWSPRSIAGYRIDFADDLTDDTN